MFEDIRNWVLEIHKKPTRWGAILMLLVAGIAVASQEGEDECTIDYPGAKTFNRLIPEIKPDEPIPPGVYEMVAYLRDRDDPNKIISESRRKFHVPQVVKGVWTPGAINVLNNAARNQVIDGVDTVIVQPIPDVQAFKEAVQKKIEWYFSAEALGGNGANIVFVWDDRPIQGDYKELVFQGQFGTKFNINPLFGEAWSNDRNEYPGLVPIPGRRLSRITRVHVHHIISRMQEEETLIKNPNWPDVTNSFRPYAPNDLFHFIVGTAVHELGHTFGLVNSRQLSTATSGWHYPNNHPPGFIMNNGKVEPWEHRFGRHGDAKWTKFDKEFLLFVLPRPNP